VNHIRKKKVDRSEPKEVTPHKRILTTEDEEEQNESERKKKEKVEALVKPDIQSPIKKK